jgi:hypothetical protein
LTPRLPAGCSMQRSELITDTLNPKTHRPEIVRRFYDESGETIHEIHLEIRGQTGIEVSQVDNNREYQRQYYQTIRRHRDGRQELKHE